MGKKTKQIYMDANASLPLCLRAQKTMTALLHSIGNPSSLHTYGRQMRAQIEEAREKVAAEVNVEPAQVIFTSSGAEANNAVIHNFQEEPIWVSAIEHVSILNAGTNLQIIPVQSNGVIDLDWLEVQLKNKSRKPRLLSVMYANNETGLLQPLKEVIEMAKAEGILVHSDAVQALGKYPLDFKELSLDYMTLSAHKIGGPQGVGALIVSPNAPLQPFIKGGGQERRRRAGTENAVGIAGFGVAVEATDRESWASVSLLRDKLEDQLYSLVPDAQIIDRTLDRLPNTICLRMPGVESQKQLMGFDLEGIAVSAGSACSSGKVEQSHVLKAMNITTKDTIRVSLYPENTEEDIDTFVSVWMSLYEREKSKQ